MNTIKKAATESAAILIVGLGIVGSLMYAFSQNSEYSSAAGAAYGQTF